MPANAVKIGPFSGGLNTYSEPAGVADKEVVAIKNFDIDLDGSLISRNPFYFKNSANAIPGVGETKLLGWYIATDNKKFLIASNTTGTYALDYSNSNALGAWVTITTTFSATSMVQYANKAYLVASPSSANPGGSWEPTGGFTAIAGMAKGTTATVYKERMFIAGGQPDPVNANRVFFSNPADFATWQPTVNFFDARSGDGQHILKLIIFQDTVVVFKEDSTYAYSYDSNPSRGAVRSINTNIGISNTDCAITYGNLLYVHHESSVYQLSNWNFTLVNVKVPFEYSVTYGTLADVKPSLSVLDDKLLVHHYDSIYVFNLRTGVWTQWDTTSMWNFNYFLQVPVDDASQPEEYVAGCRNNVNTTKRKLHAWRTTLDAVLAEEMTCTVTSKSYDYGTPYSFKRLFWWGVDLVSKTNLSYVVHPITYVRAITHDQLSNYTHTQIAQGTHAQPLSISIDVTDSMIIGNTFEERMFIKLLKSLRFRQINYTVTATTDGTISTAPVRIYSLTSFVDNKQVVPKTVN